MNSERWQKVEELFHAAIELNAPDADSFLNKACAGDENLLREVERLVRAHQLSDDFIQQTAVADAVNILTKNEPNIAGQQFGAYQIVKEIGRGGMGAVYLAERNDDEFQQRVAFKIIKRGMDTDAVLRRFRHERQILASLEHSNIARLFDGGTTSDGLPYFVMEYIEGVPITEYADAQRLSITKRLELFRRICEAVAYAHQRLVIHRDLKPSNILVTEDGVPKLLDFGIAKLMNPERTGKETNRTATGLRLMTPEYASPEQAKGLPVTTLTDVYSLGVILYELLCGRPPYSFEAFSPIELEQKISTAEPEKPSTVIFRAAETSGGENLTPEQISRTREDNPEKLRRRLRGDLDNIVLKAMRKEPEQRYASVGQFSEDVRRHLVGLPVIARPVTFAYRFDKFFRRNKITVGATALVFFILVAGIITTTWQANLARQQEERAKIEKERAQRLFNDGRKLANTVLFDYHDAIKDLPGATAVRAKLVRDALEYLDSLAAEASGDESLQRELAAAYERVGDVQGGTLFANLGDTPGAIKSYNKSLKIREDLLQANPNGFEIRRDAALSYSKIGNLFWETGDTTGALEKNRRSLALFQTLAAENSGNLDLYFQIVRIHDNLGMILKERGEDQAAIENYGKTLELLESLPAEEKQSEKARRAFSVAYEHIGTALLAAGDFANALAHNRRAFEIRIQLSKDFPDNADYRRNVAVGYYNDGEILAKMEKFREALESYRQNLQIAEKLSAQDAANEQYRSDVAYALLRVGDMLFKLGEGKQALVNYRKSLTIRAADVKTDPSHLWKRSSLIEARAKICRALAGNENPNAALTDIEETVSLMNQTDVEPTNALFRGFFADTYYDLGETFGALASRRKNLLERRKFLSSACEMYERSSRIWHDMRNRGILSKIDADKPEIIARKIAQCAAESGI